MKKFLFLKIFFLALYSPTIFAITCSTGSGGSSSPATYTWSKATDSPGFAARDSHSSVEFKGRMWVIGGWADSNFSDEAWSSTDGITWTEETKDSSKKFAARSEHPSIVYRDKIWLIGGRTSARESNDVWNSDDGKNWTQVKANNSEGFSARANHAAVVFDDGKGEKMWVFGGRFGGFTLFDDVWSSTNGITWIEETKDSSKKFTVRSGHQSVVFDEKIWITGGGAFNVTRKDVWNSDDGKNWNLVTSSATSGLRTGHQSVVFDEKMWVIGGSSNDNKNDVWNSTNGVTWTEETDNKPRFSSRSSYASEVFDNKIWVFGGLTNSDATNDVWSMVKD